MLALGCGGARSDGLLDESVRAKMLKHEEGLVAHVETEYNNVYISKKGPLLAMTTMVAKRWLFESIVNLKDPDDLTVPYSKLMPAGLLYPEKLQRILMIGLGAGSISTYLGRAMPDVQIDVVELDPGIIAAGKKYFGLQETDKVHFIESDGRVFLNRNKDPLRSHYPGRIPGAWRSVPHVDAGILLARQGSPRARRRGGGQRHR